MDSLTHKSLWWPSTPGDSLVPDPDNATRNLSMASFSTTAFLLVLLKSRLLLQGSRIRKGEFLLVTNTEVHGRISTNLDLDSNFKRNRREVFQLVKIWDIQKEQDEKASPLPKICVLVQIRGISTFMRWWLHANPFKIGWDPESYEPGLF